MKKVLLISAMLFAGAAIATPQINVNQIFSLETEIQQEKIKIEADALPEAVKTTITADEVVKAFPVAEAYQITQLDGTFHFEVIFDNGTEEKLSKKYDQEGNEIID
jgi:predicted xylose isomerase-like sugar epimerase